MQRLLAYPTFDAHAHAQVAVVNVLVLNYTFKHCRMNL
jgi:hypothetical protein